MDVLITVLPLAGIIIGTLGSYFGTRAIWSKSHTVRWDEARLRAYMEYAHALKRLSNLASRLAVARGFHHSVEPLSLDEGTPQLAEAAAERAAKWEAVLLLGDPDAIEAAREWHRAVWRLEFYARGKLTDESTWQAAIDESDTIRHAFYVAARKDLGLPAAKPEGALWPPPWLPDDLRGSDPDDQEAPDSRRAHAVPVPAVQDEAPG